MQKEDAIYLMKITVCTYNEGPVVHTVAPGAALSTLDCANTC